MKHEFRYRAGTSGLGEAGIRDAGPEWRCTCHEWTFPARPMTHRSTGNNQIEGERAHALHVKAHELLDADLVENYADGLREARKMTGER